MNGIEIIIIALSVILALAAFGYSYRQTKIAQTARASLISQEDLIRDLQNDLAARDKTVAEIKQNMAQCDDLILKLRQEVARNESALAERDQQLKEQHIEYEQLQAMTRNLQEQMSVSARESLQSKALFSTISNVAYDLAFVLDQDFAIIAISKSADTLFGRLNPIGERITDVLDSPDLEDIIMRAFSEEDSLEEQLKIGSLYYRARTQVMHYDNDQLFIGLALQDISQLVRLNRSRRDLVANISHELKTPITKIKVKIDALFHDAEKPKRKASIATIKDIARETDQLENIVQEMLDLSMIESGQAIMKLVPQNLSEIVDDALERLSYHLESKSLEVARYIPERLQVLCDRDQIRRVIMNLTRNAIRYSPEGETITLSAAIEGEDVVFSVLDKGPGVPEDQRERIFERFYQVDTSRARGEGSGLGLAISKHIIQAHGGRIWAEGNARGSGGRFQFTILNADPSEDYPEMDRGQHDFPLHTHPSSQEQNNNNASSGTD